MRGNEVKFLFLDTAARAWRGLFGNENDNAQVVAFTDAVDELKRAAGVPNLVVSTHTGARRRRWKRSTRAALRASKTGWTRAGTLTKHGRGAEGAARTNARSGGRRGRRQAHEDGCVLRRNKDGEDHDERVPGQQGKPLRCYVRTEAVPFMSAERRSRRNEKRRDWPRVTPSDPATRRLPLQGCLRK